MSYPQDHLWRQLQLVSGGPDIAGGRKANDLETEACTRLPEVDASFGLEVAGRFLEARSEPGNEKVVAAYQCLEDESDRLFAALTQGRPDSGVRVVFTLCKSPYNSDSEMIAAVRETRLLEVVSCTTDCDRRHPLLAGERGGAYDRFRAVHDLVGHAEAGTGFDRNGELAAWRAQDRYYHGLARVALGTELHGEHSVWWTTGQPADHKATLLCPQVLERALDILTLGL